MRTVAEMGTGTKTTGTRIELRRAEGGQKSARNLKIAVDAVRETGEDQREWHRMTRMTRPDCAVMCNLINIHTYTHTYIHT